MHPTLKREEATERARKPRERKLDPGGERVNIENKKKRVGRSRQRKKKEIDMGRGEKKRGDQEVRGS